MRIDILTLFPNMFEGPFSESIIKRAQGKGFLTIHIHNIRDYASDKHKTVDDTPYGGGAGMVMRVDIVDKALRDIQLKVKIKKLKTILLTPQGEVFNQKIAQRLSKFDSLIFICGHYEGFDERIRKLVDMEISIGDYILTGGEIPAAALVDSITRLIPGVLGKEESLKDESFSIGNCKSPVHRSSKSEGGKIKNYCLEYPQYTRPEVYNGLKVPEILLSGNHQKIAEWRTKEAIRRTKKRRPDLLV